MSDGNQVSHRATRAESESTKRTTPKIFLALIAVMVVAAAAVMAFGAKYIFH